MQSQHTNIGASIQAKRGIVPTSAAAGTIDGAGIDRTGFESCVLQAACGAASGAPSAQTVDAKLQESDDNTTFTDVTSGAVAQMAADSLEKHVDISLRGVKRYIRVRQITAFTGGTAPKIAVSAVVVLGGSIEQPVASY